MTIYARGLYLGKYRLYYWSVSLETRALSSQMMLSVKPTMSNRGNPKKDVTTRKSFPHRTILYFRALSFEILASVKQKI